MARRSRTTWRDSSWPRSNWMDSISAAPTSWPGRGLPKRRPRAPRRRSTGCARRARMRGSRRPTAPMPAPGGCFHVNSVIGCFGDDSPHGRVPCPVYRESYTTARDYYNLQGADRLPSPIPAQEILGIIHQSDDSFMNDAVTTVLRGHAFISLYVNPKYMNDRRWAMLARLMQLVARQRGPAHRTQHAAAASGHVAARRHPLAVTHRADAARTVRLCALGRRPRACVVA